MAASQVPSVFVLLCIASISSAAFLKPRKNLITNPSCGEKTGLTLDTLGKEFILTSPNHPENYPEDSVQCQWDFKLGLNNGHNEEENSNVINPRTDFRQLSTKVASISFQCDSFNVGKAQENGKCYGDALLLMSPHNDTIALCGQRDGLFLDLKGYAGHLLVFFKSVNHSSSPGFSCRLKLEARSEAVEALSFQDSPCECGIPNDGGINVQADRIINGQEARPNEFPWQVALVKAGKHTPFCGGSIISDRHVLTAAHCTVDIETPSSMQVLVGEHDLMTSNDEATRIGISRILEHHNYNAKTIAFDFSILVLAERLHFSKFVRPICLPLLTEEMPRNQFTSEKATVSGWGLHTFTPIENGHGPYAQRLNKLVGLEVLSSLECQHRWNEWSETYGSISITSQMICAKKDNSSACFGDSGGPLMLKTDRNVHVLIGVVSYGPQGCTHDSLPNVYARVTDVLSWIWAVIKSSQTCLPIEADLRARVDNP